MERKALCVFSKRPRPGEVKTRLAHDLGDELACQLYERWLIEVIESHRGRAYELYLAYTPPHARHYFETLVGHRCFPQQGDDLGARMRDAINRLLGRFDRVALIGCDVPGITDETVEESFHLLDDHDVVLGPAFDGGYYLIALKEPIDLFSGVPWGSSRVLQATLLKTAEQRLVPACLEAKRDIDTIQDLEALYGAGS